jgi:hypothetical protein
MILAPRTVRQKCPVDEVGKLKINDKISSSELKRLMKIIPNSRRSFLKKVGSGLVACAGAPYVISASKTGQGVTVDNPYTSVDWSSYQTFKAGMHMHTLQSDGWNTVSEVAEAYQRAGFSILSITDHDWNYPNFQVERGQAPEERASPYPKPPKPEHFPANPTWPWTDYGAGVPESYNLVGIEGNELTFRHHIASYFSFYGRWYERTNYDAPYEGIVDEQGNVVWEHDQLKAIARKGGLAVLCHPGIEDHHRWWERKSLDWYVEHFAKHGKDYLLGVEVTNNNSATRYFDEGLWDQLLARFMPERPIWGFGADDMHRLERTKQTYNLFYLAECTSANVRSAMERGQFTFARSTRGMDYTSRQNDPIPQIHSIRVDEDRGLIHIDASDWHEIRWITRPDNLDPIDDYKTSNQPFELGTVVGDQAHIQYKDPRIKGYVRAEIIRKDGDQSQTLFTNPFAVRRKV